MYKGESFEIKSPEEIKKDIDAALEFYGSRAWRFFIGDSNSLAMKTADLAEVLTYLYKKFPNIRRVTSYARAKTVRRKKLEELITLREAGLTRLHVGLETGDAALLTFIKKGATPEQMIEGGQKALEAGFELSLYVLIGIGGEEHWEAHALGTAAVLNAIDPHFIRVRTLVPYPGTPIFDQIRTGEFLPASPETILKETLKLVENLEVHSEFLSDHISNLVDLNGKFPEAQPGMTKTMQIILNEIKQQPELLETRFRLKDYNIL
jgi:radical SAM superfamily enzyme YgiQ (UPF0313 family)